MADPTKPPLMLCLLLLFFLLSGPVRSFPEKKKLLLRLDDAFQWKATTKIDISSCFSHKSRWEKGAAVLEMKDRQSCSSINWENNLQKRLIMDNNRLLSLNSRIKTLDSSANTKDTQIPLASGVSLQTLNYVVAVELGGKKMTVIVDTGSDLTWVQCQPCRLCYNQQDPIFDPLKSPSYEPIRCNSSTCGYLQYATGNSGVCGSSSSSSPCNYVVSYGDGSYTRGELGMERLDFGDNPVHKFVFGCGRNNKGLYGGASGLMGLGRSDLSLISQTSAMFGGVFSYCLPTTAPDSSGSLVLGGNFSVFKNTTPISYTRMIPNPQLPTFYFLNLTGITIGGIPVSSPSFGNSGILIDSGTVITRLPPSIYNGLKSEFLKQFSGVPPAPGFSILDTCFNLTGYDEVEIPTVKMEFEGNAEMSVDVNGVLYFVKMDASQVCLAMASLSYEDEIGIIGNYQQRNQRVVYDSKNSVLGFAEEACSFSY